MISLPVNHTSGFFPLIKPSRHLLHPISATLIPSSPSSNKQQQVYQPFRPPPSPVPSKFRSLDTSERLDVLANRLGLWHEWAPLIPSLVREGFTPPSIEEATGISGVEQNRLVVAAQVRDSLFQSKTDPDIVSAFDTGGAELLYEIRLLSITQRAEAARFVVENRLDAEGARDLARAMKDFPRRRGDKSWEYFNYALPGDCLSFMYYRQSREHKDPSEQRTVTLQEALQVAQSEKAKSVLVQELEGKGEGRGKETEDVVKVPIVRMKLGEVAEASVVVVLPVCRAEEREKGFLEAPLECRTEGEFGVVVAEKGWERWVVFPGWEPVVSLGRRGVVVAFGDARVLPWKANRWYKEEAILVVADRGRKEVEHDDGFYLVTADGGGLKVERGSALKGRGVHESLAAVVLVVRPPREETDDQLADEDWE
ncbi:rubisco accumulation factor 1 chloroplastic [Tripterygium wilfordii]|uniref:Rubisco accumulation factor 1 chloroplastic n=1 Tax=Tripterygium wilfordii TaxID=458696 RepID=A0A7J7DKV3_TRIWF|nr:rubisco accumulation factor 1.1, chloroplastic-like [Tripterygium wilfordii]KAF5746961.1 rubisco accumulation factor 1 chloroplastic [Tripterygium wilfordii]